MAAGDSVTPAAPAAPPPGNVRLVDLDYRSVLVVIAALVGLMALSGLVGETPRTVTALVIAAIIALAVDPVVRWVQRRAKVGRSGAVAIVVAAGVLALSGLGALVVPPAIHQAKELRKQLPHVVHEIGRLPLIGHPLEKAHVPTKVQDYLENLPDKLSRNTEPITRAGRSLAGGALAAVVTLLFATTLLLDGERLVRAGRRLVPVSQRERADTLAELGYRVVGRYVAGSLLVSAVAGLIILVAGLVLRVPLIPLAAIWFALWDLVPQVGGAAGAIPFVLLGLSHGAGTGVICVIVVVLYLQLKHQVFDPVLIGHAVRLSPPTTMIAALIGIAAGGVVGGLISVPLVGAVKAVYLELRSERKAAVPSGG
ncbi:MAG: AI-2E family transporter [Actinobacteria bacterium]|nr:AI-2E family transporter [Actinomycetota bacterium]MBV9933982.1 AI-2E family transporter [Actinomycetota bacterium]